MEQVTTEVTATARFINPTRIRLSKDQEHLLIFLPGGLIIRKHINWFKAAMKIEFRSAAAVRGEVAN